MKSVIFTNKGELDLRALKTFGVSVKEGDNPIGFFGTGLKYALAVLVRESQDVTLRVGENTYKIGAAVSTIRGREFRAITLGDEPLAFTTELGKKWGLWRAYRELYCNAIDEGGGVHVGDLGAAEPGYTQVSVSGAGILGVHHNRAKYFITTKPLFATPLCEVHPGENDGIFYRGVRISDSDCTRFTYNMLRPMTLTEDRTMQYNFEALFAMRTLALTSTNEAFIERVLTAPSCNFEARLDFDIHPESEEISDAFMGVCANYYRKFNPDFNRSAMALFKKIRRKTAATDSSLHLSGVQTKQMHRAKTILSLLGCELDQYPIIVTDALADNVLGLAEDGKIFISRRVFDMGTKMLVGTLYEEFVHLKYDLHDETRQMQNFLIDRMFSLVEEAVIGEPI